MTGGLLTAGSGQRWENELVAALDRPGAPLTVLRRCVDMAEVLAEAGTGTVAVVVVAADLRRLDTEAVHRLAAAAVAIVAVYPSADLRAPVRLERIGIEIVVPDDAGSDTVLAAVRSAVLDRPRPPEDVGGSLLHADPRAALPVVVGPDEPIDLEPPSDPPPAGRVVAVWGPTGAPGRSTVAAGLAVAAAASSVATLLVDADVYGGILANAFGLLDESPGLAGACRMAANGRLDLAELTALVWSLPPNLRLLTGITRADRWPEVRPSAIPLVLGVARAMAPLVVMDLGFSLETDEEITYDTSAPRRNGATLAALADADFVLAVGSADPAGLERLVRGLAEMSETVPSVRPQVILNRCRSSIGSVAEATAAVEQFTGLDVLAAVPFDGPAMDRAWRDGRPVAEVAPGSPATKAFNQLAARVVPVLARMGAR